MNKLLLTIWSLLVINSVFGSVPTTEGLFRNANNADISANLVVVKLNINVKPSNQVLDAPISEIPDDKISETAIESETKYYVKFLLSEDGDGRVQVIQVVYLNSKMSDDEIVDVRYFSNLKEKVRSGDKVQGLFYATLSSLALNRSQEISEFLKANSKNYKSNKDLIDPEKMSLYEKYKRYLTLTKEDESLKETMDNPMKPGDEEGKDLVRLIQSRSFMNKDPFVSLIKEQSDFFWKVENDIISAMFESKTMRLEKINFGEVAKNIKFSFDDYILFDGTHELPKKIRVDTPDSFIEIRTSSLNHLMLGNKPMPKRYAEYKAALQQITQKKPLPSVFLMR